jgi:hypothetical protein
MIREPQKRDAVINRIGDYVYKLGCDRSMTAAHPVPPFTREIEPHIVVEGFGMDRLQERCIEYSHFSIFAGDGKPLLSGTVGWEFGKHIVTICDHYRHDPHIQLLARTFLMDVFKAMTPVVCDLVEPAPKQRVGFFRRLFQPRRSNRSK